MDKAKQKRNREWLLLGLVSTMALLNNLPAEILASWHVDVGLIMPALGMLLMLAMMLYVRIFFFLLFTLLIFGSNLPDSWAVRYGVDREFFLITLVIMVVIYCLNYLFKLLPDGLNKYKNKNSEATASLVKAIEKNHLSSIQTILSIDFDLNETDEHGLTPLMHAARMGNYQVVKMLLVRSASALVIGPEGRASDMALAHNFSLVAERLKISEYTEAKSGMQTSARYAETELLGN